MGKETEIEWTDATWNPIRGCTKISAGCANCYAETFSERWRGLKGHPFENGFDLNLVYNKLEEPIKWKKPKRIFVNSMSDLFHEKVPFHFIDKIFDVIFSARHHIFQILTKRAGRMQEIMENYNLTHSLFNKHVSRHIWFGVSIENKKVFDRIDFLRKVPTENRFLSVEPMLEDLDGINLDGISWVIAGGESGRKARPISEKWALNLRDLCEKKSIPFFFKQWGGKNKKSAGNILDGKQYLEIPKRMKL